MGEGTRALIAAGALLLANCGPKTLVLPEDPIDRAATCGSVAAASQRAATTDINASLSLEAIGQILHYPMLAGAAGESFSSDRAAAVQKRMSELQDSVVEGKWQELIPACRTAFPTTAVEEVTLPADRFTARLGCDELADFLRKALEAQDDYAAELRQYRQLSDRLDASLAEGLRSRAGSSPAAQQEERRKALAAMTKAGPPIAAMRQCLDRFG